MTNHAIFSPALTDLGEMSGARTGLKEKNDVAAAELEAA